MARLARSLLGAIGGILWGAGTAVLIQQYGIWPLDAALAYGAPLGAAAVSSLWARMRGRRSRGATVAAVVLMLPVMTAAFQGDTCDAFIDDQRLADASPADPIVIDPEDQSEIAVAIFAGDVGERPGEIWIEFGGIPTLTRSGTLRGDLVESFDLEGEGFAELGRAPGIYHVGGSIDGVCTVDGYVRISGNPMSGPVGQGSAGAIAIGLLFTWVAGRPPASAPPGPGRRRRLDPAGDVVEVADVEVRSPGLDGEVEVYEPSARVLREVAHWTENTREVLAGHHVEVERVVELSQVVESEGAAGLGGVVDHVGRPAFQLELPNPGPGRGQVILGTDESGVLGWHFPRAESGVVDVHRAGDVLRYRVARKVTPGGEPGSLRGLAGAVGSKVLSSLVFPLLDPVFEMVGERFARVWEEKKRPYRFRTFSPDDFGREEADAVDDAIEWDRLAAGKALLFVHGTFSRAHTGFGELSEGLLADLHEVYGGRVFAFDHFTLSDDPRRNAEWFFDHLPAGAGLELDIVCHSRGGLVSRVLAEKQGELGAADRGVTVDKVVFVGVPNAGTPLTEPAFVGDFIDTYTNLLNFVPGVAVVDVFEGLVTVVKHMAVGAVAGLDGLQAMRPSGGFLRWLNQSSGNPSRYFAVAGDYEPQLAGWSSFAKDRLMDAIFHEANDLVVPTAGTFGDNGSNHFPIRNRHEISADDGVDHTGYFANPVVRARLIEWLRS